jgi:aryl-alcohol dehydrogenase-like predicted oxidoreductase
LIRYSPFDLEQDRPGGVIPVARELGAAIFSYAPIGRGLTTGRFVSIVSALPRSPFADACFGVTVQRSFNDFPQGDLRRTIAKFQPKNFSKINALADALGEIGQTHGNATPAQITLAWLLARGEDIIPIPGSKHIKYIEENVAASNIKLSGEEVRKITELSDDFNNATMKDPMVPSFILAMAWVETPPLG